MDVGSIMNALQAHGAAKRVASGVGSSRGNGMLTAATATTGAGKLAASSGKLPPGTTRVAPSKSAAAGATPPASSTTSTQNITSSDFLTLLVAEMQNQDPTQPTDPNTYIQQLVSVNSLQQLISIDGELGQATSGTKTGGAAANAVPASSPLRKGTAEGT